MAREYPRIGKKVYNVRLKQPCSICRHRAKCRVDVEVSYMRGDDLVFFLCNDHQNVSAEELVAKVRRFDEAVNNVAESATTEEQIARAEARAKRYLDEWERLEAGAKKFFSSPAYGAGEDDVELESPVGVADSATEREEMGMQDRPKGPAIDRPTPYMIANTLSESVERLEQLKERRQVLTEELEATEAGIRDLRNSIERSLEEVRTVILDYPGQGRIPHD